MQEASRGNGRWMAGKCAFLTQSGLLSGKVFDERLEYIDLGIFGSPTFAGLHRLYCDLRQSILRHAS